VIIILDVFVIFVDKQRDNTNLARPSDSHTKHACVAYQTNLPDGTHTPRIAISSFISHPHNKSRSELLYHSALQLSRHREGRVGGGGLRRGYSTQNSRTPNFPDFPPSIISMENIHRQPGRKDTSTGWSTGMFSRIGTLLNWLF
jgi:hypothetical protein